MCCWKLRGTWSWIMWLFPAVWSFAPCRLHLTICGSRFSRQSFKPNPEGLSLRIYIVRAPRFWSIYFVAVHGRLYVPFSRENIENILFVLAKKFKLWLNVCDERIECTILFMIPIIYLRTCRLLLISNILIGDSFLYSKKYLIET